MKLPRPFLKYSGRRVALDLDSRCLRVVQYQAKGDRPRILGLHRALLPEGLDLTSAEAVGGFMGQTLKELGLSGALATISVPRSQAVLKPLMLPAGTPEAELAGMVQFQIGKDLPFAVDEAVVDFIIEHPLDSPAGPGADATEGQEPDAKGLNLLVAAVRLPLVDRFRQIAQVAGIHLLRLDLRPYANMRCIEYCVAHGPQERMVLVNIMPGETEIDVLVGESLAFTRSAGVKLPLPEAAPEVREQAVNGVVLEILRSLQSFQAVHRGDINGVLVAGDTGFEQAVVEALGLRVQIPCELFDPAPALRLNSNLPASGFVAALGLALPAKASVASPFDFLNPKRPPVVRNVRRTQAIAAAIVGAVLLLGAVTAGWMHLNDKKKIVDDLREKITAETTINTAVKKLANRVKAIEAWEADNIQWLDHWAYLTSVLPSAKDAYINNFKTTPEGMMTFNVKAQRSDVFTELGKKLTDMRGYTLVPRRESENTADPFKLGYVCDTTMQVRVDPKVKVELAGLRPVPRDPDDVSAEMLPKLWSGGGARLAEAPPTVPTPTVPGPAPTASGAPTPTVPAPGNPATGPGGPPNRPQVAPAQPPRSGQPGRTNRRGQ